MNERVQYTVREMADYFPVTSIDEMVRVENVVEANPLFTKRLVYTIYFYIYLYIFFFFVYLHITFFRFLTALIYDALKKLGKA
jgi:hypothetical protein